jgi:hypothetical protein
MGILQSLLGNATEVDVATLERDLSAVLVEGEKVERAYQFIRDAFVFTNMRLVLVNRQGVTGSKTEWVSLPYRSISHFSLESAGHFDLDAELKLWIKGEPQPLTRQLKRDTDSQACHRTLATYVLRHSS